MHTNGFAHAFGVVNYDYDLIEFASYSESSAGGITLLMRVVNSQGFQELQCRNPRSARVQNEFFFFLFPLLRKLTIKTPTRKFSVLYDTDSAGCACKSGDVKTEFLLFRKDKY